MTIFVDIDDTICHTPVKRGYENALPLKENIAKINKLFREGDEIVYWTARGASSGKDWRELTTKQLNEWGCLYDELRLDKPSFDKLIDDKGFRIDEI